MKEKEDRRQMDRAFKKGYWNKVKMERWKDEAGKLIRAKSQQSQ
jgi:hypothetical protein